ncbi:nucleotidyltransferase domain-containing protein [Pseudalkalibacillus hwajinpoensis]
MKQEEAVHVITASLKKDESVQAIFLKGSMGRNEYDENSDVDLYCLVDEKDKKAFLTRRKEHLEAYDQLLFYDEIFIIAPQIIAVYDNMLHLDLFTVTDESLIEKDYFSILYDKQQLTLSNHEFIEHVDDTAFFLFQYEKAHRRGNDIWAVHMLNHVMVHYSRVLLHRYYPERAQLGLKTIDSTFQQEQLQRVKEIFQNLTVNDHEEASMDIIEWLKDEEAWINEQVKGTIYTKKFLHRMIHGE